MKLNKQVLVAALVFTTASVLAFPQAKRIVAPPGSAVPGLPYSPAVRSGDLLFVAGQVATDADGNLITGGIAEQTRKSIENLQAVLAADGLGLADVVSTKVYLSDARYYAGMNEAYAPFFPETPPARATIETDLALEGSLIEIQAIAHADGRNAQVVSVPGEGTNTRPYSRALRIGDYLFIAGLVSQNLSDGSMVTGDIGTQTAQILDNAKAFAEAAGFEMSDLVSSRVYLTDTRDFGGMNQAYRTYFGDVPPTRATVRGRLMSPETKVEIMLMGVKGEKEQIGNAGGTLSSGIKVGNMLFMSGFVRGSRALQGDMSGQTRAVLEQITGVLGEAGMDFTDVVNSSVFITDVRNFGAMNDVYREFVTEGPPPRATVGAALMAARGLVEIEMFAARDD